VAFTSQRPPNARNYYVKRGFTDYLDKNGDLDAIVAPSLLLTNSAVFGRDDSDSSLPSYEELLGTARSIGDVRAEGWVLARLGFAAFQRGDSASAIQWLMEELELGSKTGLWDAVGFAIVQLGEMAYANGDDSALARLHGSIERIMPALEVSLGHKRIGAYRTLVAAARERMGQRQFDRLASASTTLGWDDAAVAALDYARRLATSLAVTGEQLEPRPVEDGRMQVPPDGAAAALTPREHEVLVLLATGARNNEIATRLRMRPKTVMHHATRIYAKLGLRGRAEAAAWAHRNRVVEAARPS
jgi:DNA-binding CsgD family transcriptional regulator